MLFGLNLIDRNDDVDHDAAAYIDEIMWDPHPEVEEMQASLALIRSAPKSGVSRDTLHPSYSNVMDEETTTPGELVVPIHLNDAQQVKSIIDFLYMYTQVSEH